MGRYCILQKCINIWWRCAQTTTTTTATPKPPAASSCVFSVSRYMRAIVRTLRLILYMQLFVCNAARNTARSKGKAYIINRKMRLFVFFFKIPFLVFEQSACSRMHFVSFERV